MKNPDDICEECALRHAREPWHIPVSEFRQGKCDLCKEENEVTKVINVGYLKPGWSKRKG